MGLLADCEHKLSNLLGHCLKCGTQVGPVPEPPPPPQVYEPLIVTQETVTNLQARIADLEMQVTAAQAQLQAQQEAAAAAGVAPVPPTPPLVEPDPLADPPKKGWL